MKGDLRGECKELQSEVEEKYSKNEQEAVKLSHSLHSKTNNAFAKFEAIDKEAIQETLKTLEKISSLIDCISTSVRNSREYMRSAHQNDEATLALEKVLTDLDNLLKEHHRIASDL